MKRAIIHIGAVIESRELAFVLANLELVMENISRRGAATNVTLICVSIVCVLTNSSTIASQRKRQHLRFQLIKTKKKKRKKSKYSYLIC